MKSGNDQDGPSSMDREPQSFVDLGSDVTDPAQDFSNIEFEDLDTEDLNSLSAENRKTLIRNEIRKVVRQYGQDGISVSEICEVTGLSDTAVRNHLDALCKLREVYKQKRNKQLYLYYPNGKPLHGVGKKRIERGDTTLELQLAQGRNDDYFVHILEKRFSLMEGETTEGAIMFPLEMLDEFFDEINELAQEVE